MASVEESRNTPPGILNIQVVQCNTPGDINWRCKTPGLNDASRSKSPHTLINVKNAKKKFGEHERTFKGERTEVTLGPNNEWAQITIPGLSASHFTRKGTLNVTEIHNLMFTGIWAIGHHSYFPGYHRLMSQTNGKGLFLACSDLHISRQFHQETKQQFFYLPIEFMEYRHRVNDSSYSMERALLNHNTNAIFAASTDTYVMMGSKMNGPVILPHEFKKRFKSVHDETTGQETDMYDRNDKKSCGEGRHMLIAPPERSFQYRVRVAPSDTESNNMTGSRGYSRFIMDCAANAGKAGFYDKVFNDISGLQVSRLALVFMGKSKAGQDLVVYTWADTENENTLHFQIMHAWEEGKTVIHGLICFYLD